MKLTTALLLAAAAPQPGRAASAPPPADLFFANPPASSPSSARIPTSYESAVLGRRVLALTPLATLSTVFPPSPGPAAEERRPAGVEGSPVGLPDYIADCGPGGDPTVLAVSIATTFRNARAGSNVSAAVQWVPPYPPSERIRGAARGGGLLAALRRALLGGDGDGGAPDAYPFSAANLPRFSLLGHLEPVEPASEEARAALEACFVAAHPDARHWLPGNRIHRSGWARLVVRHVYWVGGFGDRAYIGWIPAGEWRNVTEAEWRAVRLPGEKKGWKEWSAGGTGGPVDL